MLWINFLHFYQPSNSDACKIEEAADLSYRKLLKIFEKHPGFKCTLNISGCLLLRWEHLQYFDLIEGYKKFINSGQIEITGSAAYHPILPLMPEKEIITQIKENEEILYRLFGRKIKLSGFFMPEMAYGQKAAKIIKKMGYKWIILDEIAMNGKLGEIDFQKIYSDEQSGLNIIFRSRKISSSYVPETLNKMSEKKIKEPIITATDGELYGLRHHDSSGHLEKMLEKKIIETKTISEFMMDREIVKINPIACNWESNLKELKADLPYFSWYNKKNKIQTNLWTLANLAQSILVYSKKDKNYYWARWHLVRGLASCSFWWAGAKDFSHIYGPLAWNPDEIERGLDELVRSVRALDNVKTRDAKIKAERLYIKIKKLIWEKHWNYYWKKN